MIAPNRNGRAPYGATADDGATVPGHTHTVPEYRHILPMGATPWDEDVVGQIHAADDFATDGAHRCEEGSCPQEVWYLAPEDTHALEDGGEPKWTITTMCLACRCIAVFYGATVQRTHWQDGAA